MHIDVTKYRGLSVRSFDIEELHGQDELDAVGRATFGGGAQQSLAALQVMQTEQLIAQSISKVDGVVVTRPYAAWKDWTIKTREFVQMAYHRINGVSKEDREDFLKTHFAEGAPPASPDSSTSGSGSPGT